jgi:hypothetical protein
VINHLFLFSPNKHIGKKEEKHERRKGEPTVNDFIAAKFVQNDKKNRHDHNNDNEYRCIGNRHPQFSAI